MTKDALRPDEYAAYYHQYIAELGDLDLMEALNNGKVRFIDLLHSLTQQHLHYRYAAGKWTLAEVVQHIIDVERVFQYRALRFARNDTTELPGFDQDIYGNAARANDKMAKEISREYEIVREASITLFGFLNAEELTRMGKASGFDFSVRALGFIICGHQAHHEQVISERYLKA